MIFNNSFFTINGETHCKLIHIGIQVVYPMRNVNNFIENKSIPNFNKNFHQIIFYESMEHHIVYNIIFVYTYCM